MKQCFKCGVVKPLDEFYAHPEMADGHLGKCKACAKKDVAENYRLRFAQKQQYEVARFRRPERKAQIKTYAIKRKQLHPERRHANNLVSSAIRCGRLTPQPCQVCGGKAQAHHDDYSKPLDVQWLCFAHHRQRHGQLRHLPF
jgi:hypothetical protein